MPKNKIIVVFIFSLFFSINIYSQNQKIDWKPFEFLLGNWVGEGNGQPGKGSGSFTLEYDLEKNILVRKNHNEFPATANKPAAIHDDLMIVYPFESTSFRAIYFDNESHVINYSITYDADKLMFISDKTSSSPRFRLTYFRQSDSRVNIIFEIAMPGNPDVFSKYLEGVVIKQN